MRFFVAVMALVLPALAGAQTPPASSADSPPGITPPKGAGAPHICGRPWYPSSAVHEREQGDVDMIYRIAADGTVKDIVVVNTSGFGALDEAAANCVSHFVYTPAMKDGHPVEVDWTTFVQWRITGGHPAMPDSPARRPHRTDTAICDAPPPGPPGRAVVAFTVTASGALKDPTLVHPSGDEAFDRYATGCIGRFRYAPAESGGAPLDWPWGAQVVRGP